MVEELPSSLRECLEGLSTIDSQPFRLNNQRKHRVDLFQSWLEIAQDSGYDLESSIVGKQTLDIGCGQGDMIEVFAGALKAQGNKESRVIGVDPARLDYGEFSWYCQSTFQDAQSMRREPLHPRPSAVWPLSRTSSILPLLPANHRPHARDIATSRHV